MLLNFQELVKKHSLQFKKVVQVGAHWGQEYQDYIDSGAEEIVFIEPCQKAFAELEKRFWDNPKVKLINYACVSPEDNVMEMEMFTGDETVNKGMSNSLLKPAKHLQIHPEVEFPDKETVMVSTLDALLCGDHDFDLLVMDCQGFEGHVLRGATETLKNIKYIYSEVNKDSVYENCTMIDELEGLLWEFQRVEIGKWVGGMWTDALYINKNLL